MRSELRVRVADWCAWAPGRESRSAWRSWAGIASDAGGDQPLPALPMMLRRRATPFGQRVVGTALACGEAVATARYVLASRHGEMTRTIAVLADLAACELPSPAEFSMSVHHGLAGLLSIHGGNHAGHTALAAGPESFGHGLMEAAACVVERPDEPVLLIYGDEPLPEPYDRFSDAGDAVLPLALAILLGPATQAEGIRLAASPSTGGPLSVSPALDFVRFLIAGDPAVSVGPRTTWRWCHDA